jgi:carboxypeptidase Q
MRPAAVLLFLGLAACREYPRPAPGGEAEVTRRIVAAALADDRAWQHLAWLTDRIGHRIAGSPQLERAVTWAADTLRQEGLQVRLEPVTVPHWQRGVERGAIVSPVETPLRLIGLGFSAPGAVEAEVIVVGDFAELERRAGEVAGRIVLFDRPMKPYDGTTHYGEAVVFRGEGPQRASRLGARAALVRSITARSLRTPHTGGTRWEGATPIPAAAVATEDAALLRRLAAAGKVVVRLELASTNTPAQSANVIAELPGRERPGEIVLLAAHLDSWDVGQGAHDDGAGCVIVMRAVGLLRQLGLRPRRTIRVVLYTAEEVGTQGAKAYLAAHRGELSRHVAAIETDSGGFRPTGWRIDPEYPNPRSEPTLREIAAMLGDVGPLVVRSGHTGSDIEDLGPAGVPLIGHAVDGSTYFDIHHTEADTLDKVDPLDLRRNVAVMAVTAWVLAEREASLR